jgi:hypothetical protein
MKKTLTAGWVFSLAAFFCIVALFNLYPGSVPLPGWYRGVMLFLFFYVLFMVRILVLITKNGTPRS